MITCLPYTDFYTKDDIKRATEEFLTKWKGYNFLRRDKIPLETQFTDLQLSVMTSAKRNTDYVLYRGLKGVYNNDIYIDDYPSSWTTNISVARRFGSSKILSTVIPPEYVLIDIKFIYQTEYEDEVIVLPGRYDMRVIYDKNNDPDAFIRSSLSSLSSHLNTLSSSHFNSYDITIETFTHELKDALSKPRNGITVDKLKSLCRQHGVKNYSKLKKAEIVELLVEFNNKSN